MIIKTFLFLIFCANGICSTFDKDLEHAKAIANSRIHFYEIRGELLSGTDEASAQFQETICNQAGTAIHLMPSLSFPGAAQNLMSIFAGIAQQKREVHSASLSTSFLTNAQNTNQACKEEWVLVLAKITSIARSGTKEVVIADFNALMENNFSRRGMVEGVASAIKTSATVSDDLNSIASDLRDFKQVCTLLEPYLLQSGITLSKLRKGGERLKREFLEKKNESLRVQALREGDDVDALVAYITGVTGEAPVEKSSKKSSKKNKATDVVVSKSTELCASAVITPLVDSPSVSEMLEDPNQSVISAAVDSLLVSGKEAKEDNSAINTGLDSLSVGDEENDDDFDFAPDYFKYEKPKLFTTNNPKLTRQRDKEAGLAAKVFVADAAEQVNEAARPSLILKPSHISTLQSILSIASHPPKWRNALSALSSVISQFGGSFNGALGKGSSVEFWIGGVRFLVDSSHGSDHEMMYPDQMVFMRKGLERAGITLDLLSTL